jgi:hypothetical protein
MHIAFADAAMIEEFVFWESVIPVMVPPPMLIQLPTQTFISLVQIGPVSDPPDLGSAQFATKYAQPTEFAVAAKVTLTLFMLSQS